jgi:hypothetical protein
MLSAPSWAAGWKSSTMITGALSAQMIGMRRPMPAWRAGVCARKCVCSCVLVCSLGLGVLVCSLGLGVLVCSLGFGVLVCSFSLTLACALRRLLTIAAVVSLYCCFTAALLLLYCFTACSVCRLLTIAAFVSL